MNAQLWFELCLALATAAGLLGGWWLFRPSDHAQAQQRFAQALEDLKVPVSIWDREDRLIACNEPFRVAYSEIAKLLQPGLTYAVMRKRYYQEGGPRVAGGRSEADFLHHTTRRRSGPQLIETMMEIDGRTALLMDYRNEKGAMLSLQLDISEQRAEVVAAQAGRQFRDGLVELSEDIYWQMDASGRITRFAAAGDDAGSALDGSRYVGCTLRELPGFWANEDRLNQFEAALRALRPTAWLCVRVADDKSAPTWLMLRARPMRQRDGTFAGYHGWVRDLSAMEQALATTRNNESGRHCPEPRNVG